MTAKEALVQLLLELENGSVQNSLDVLKCLTAICGFSKFPVLLSEKQEGDIKTYIATLAFLGKQIPALTTAWKDNPTGKYDAYDWRSVITKALTTCP